jgi:hypothetical protein
MGCYGSRDSAGLREEEKSIVKRETKLGFQNHTARNADAIIHRYSHEGKINANQMEEIIAQMKLEFPAWKTKDSVDAQFLDKFKIADSEDYDLNRFKYAAIMLSRSTSREMATVFFEFADPEFTKKMQRNAFDAILADLIMIVCDYTPVLTKTEEFKDEHSQVMQHTKLLLEVKDLVRTKLVADIFGSATTEEISKDEMYAAIETNLKDFPKIFTPRGMREYCMYVYEH